MPCAANGSEIGDNVCQYLARWSSIKRGDMQLRRDDHVSQVRAREEHLRAVRGPPWAVAERAELPLAAAQGRHDIDSASVALRAKGDLAPVWRPVRLPITRGRGRELDRIAAGDRLHPDVE